MKKGIPSRTAFNVCSMRAYESRKSKTNRICYDPLAYEFVKAFIRQFDRPRVPEFLSWRIGKMNAWFNYTFRFPSLHTSIVSRCRYIDEVLEKEMQKGLEQIVILGAGFDTRAYRFPEIRKNEILVFEIDFPATQEFKLDVIEKNHLIENGHVCYISHDFNKGALEEKLARSGFNAQGRTLYIWEGVSMYLSAESVKDVFKFVAQNSGPFSRILFDYLAPLILESPQKDPELNFLTRLVQQLGESFFFCADYDRISAMTDHAGLKIVENLDSQSCQDRFFPNSNRPFCKAFLFANAEVITKQYRRKK